MQLDLATLKKLWPGASPALLADIAGQSGAVFTRFNINTPPRVAHFMAQISHESNGGTITEESLNYTTPAHIAAVWPSRFTTETAQAFIRKPRELANKVYNGRMGNRPGTDDGWNFRGRGLLQITGRESYQRVGGLVGLDLENSPSLVNAPDKALLIAASEFVSLKCLPACDIDDIRTVTKLVNGGYIGIDSRRAWLAKWKLALPDLPGELPPDAAEIAQIDAPLPRQADGDPEHPTSSDKITEKLTLAATAASPVIAAFSDWKIVAAFGVVAIVGLTTFFVLKRRGYFS